MKLITLCTGNICRSPMAEGLLKDLIKDRGCRGLSVDSAGTHNYHPMSPPDRRAIRVMQKNGHDISHLRARVLTEEDLAPAGNVILAASDEHLRHAKKLKNRSGGQATLLKLLDFHPAAAGRDLADPYYGDEADFQSVYNLLTDALPPLLDRIMQQTD